MAEDMDVDNGAVAPAADKGKAPMTNGTAHSSKGYELPWVRTPNGAQLCTRELLVCSNAHGLQWMYVP